MQNLFLKKKKLKSAKSDFSIKNWIFKNFE